MAGATGDVAERPAGGGTVPIRCDYARRRTAVVGQGAGAASLARSPAASAAPQRDRTQRLVARRTGGTFESVASRIDQSSGGKRQTPRHVSRVVSAIARALRPAPWWRCGSG